MVKEKSFNLLIKKVLQIKLMVVEWVIQNRGMATSLEVGNISINWKNNYSLFNSFISSDVN